MLKCYLASLLVVLSIATHAFASNETWVQWPIESGGNGHYYMTVSAPGGISWTAAHAQAMAFAGYLVSVTSAAESQFVFSLVDSPTFWQDLGGKNYGPWIGGFQPNGSQEPSGGWTWTSGEPFSYTNWRAGEPNNEGGENCMHLFWIPSPTRSDTWNDLWCERLMRGYIVESLIPEPTVLSQLGLAILLMRGVPRSRRRLSASTGSAGS